MSGHISVVRHYAKRTKMRKHLLTVSMLCLLLANCTKDKIHIESCPTSNLVVGHIDGYASHPAFELTSGDRPLSLSINTDDPGLFHVRPEDEYTSMGFAAQEVNPEMKSAIMRVFIIRENY